METLIDYIGKWGGVNLRNICMYEEFNYIHPDDYSLLKSYPYLMDLHQCVDRYENYIVVEFYKIRIRILSEVFHPLNISPQFKPYENIKFHNSKRVLEYGIIKGIHWHNAQMRFYYDVEVKGEIKTQRYFNEDLKKLQF